MDYIEVFKNLKTNNKYGRKSPHKAVLMLTVIELYEHNELIDNEIVYDDSLKTMFLQVWNNVLPDEPLFHPDAYFPFWYLQSDSFWHIVPKRGKEDILSLMRDTNIKPSEAKIYDCVKYAELDDDLYFLMTLPSGRSSLKRVLLETYTNLSEKQINRMTESVYNTIDYSASALSDYVKILSNKKTEKNIATTETDNNLVRQFQSLNEDIQIVLNLQYFSFLKSHRNEREIFKEICPTVYDLLDKIINHPLKQGDIVPSFTFIYDSFLSDLKIALMSEEGSFEIIDKIGQAVDLLRGNINNVSFTEPLAEFKYAEPPVRKFEESSCDEEDSSSHEFIIDNKQNRCSITDIRGNRVFSSDGNLIRLDGIFYKINYNESLISMTIIQEDNKGKFLYGKKILSAHFRSPLYTILDKHYYLKQFKAVKYDYNCDEYYVQVDSRWYGYSGFYADLNGKDNEDSSDGIAEQSSDVVEVEHVFLDSRGNIIEKKMTSSCDIPKTEFAKEDRRGKPWTENEEELITLYFRQGKDPAIIAELVGRTEVAIKSRLGSLGLIDYTYGQDDKLPEEEVMLKQEPDVDASQFSVRIGTTLRLLPSQLIGDVIKLRFDNKGNRKLLIKTNDERIIEIYDDIYIYEIINKQEKKRAPRPRIKGRSRIL